MEPIILEEWEITLVVRVIKEEIRPIRPDNWDYTALLDLATGSGEQAWVDSAKVINSGTEEDLESLR